MKHTHFFQLPMWLIPLITACLAVCLALCALYGGESAGLSDNGDFSRVMKVNRLEDIDPGRNSFRFQQYYTMELDGDTFWEQAASTFSTEGADLYSSPHSFFIQCSKWMNYCYNRLTGRPPAQYDIAFLAMLYLLFFGAACYLILRYLPGAAPARQGFAGLLFLFFFCDAGYLLYFQSLYGEALQFVSLLMSIGCWLRLYDRPRRPGTWIALYTALYFFAGSKLANLPLAVILGAVSLLLLRGLKPRVQVLAVILCLALVWGAGSLYQNIPGWMAHDTTYQAVFFGALKNTKTPDEDLAQLGIDEKYKPLINTNIYQLEHPMDVRSEAFQAEFYPQVNKFDVACFYLSHPFRLLAKLDTSVMSSASIRPPYLGNLSSQTAAQITRCSIWSWLRVSSRLLYQSWFVFPVLLLAALLLLGRTVACLRRDAPKRTLPFWGALLALVACTWMALAIPVITNGEADLAKHLFLFIHLEDLLLFFALAGLGPRLPALLFTKGEGRGKAFLLGGAIWLAAAFLFSLPTGPAAPLVTFGTFQGTPLKWEVVRESTDTMTLVCAAPVTQLPLDQNGGNLWRLATLRNWLEKEFIACFTPQERQRLVPVVQKELLSYPNRALAEGGDHPHFWHSDPRKAADLMDSAYYQGALALVSLPTPDLYGAIHTRTQDPYWILCPYGNNGTMEWIAKPDGFVLFQDANRPAGVRPVITIRK